MVTMALAIHPATAIREMIDSCETCAAIEQAKASCWPEGAEL